MAIEVFWAVRNPWTKFLDTDDLECMPIRVLAADLAQFVNGFRHRWHEYNITLYIGAEEQEAIQDAADRLSKAKVK